MIKRIKNNMYKKETTCKCIKDLEFEDIQFHKGREYQVDIYPLYYQIYQNGGWNDYIFMEGEDKFNEYFKEIK